MESIKNEYLTVSVNEKGAELASIKKGDKEYLWHADPAFWGRTAPVLFPFVGAVSGGVYRCEGTEYKMGQHGFARDSKFTLVDKKDNALTYELVASDETLAKYPYRFSLKISYELSGSTLKVVWTVENTDEKDMPFSIGGHPAFMCPLAGEGEQKDYALLLKKDGNVIGRMTAGILDDGLLSDETVEFALTDGKLPLEEHLFDRDALIVEGRQADEVSLVAPNGDPYITVQFDTPLFGLWSPAGKHAPFVCIEPWYGRCDRVGYAGELCDREYGQTLQPGKVFGGGFKVKVQD